MINLNEHVVVRQDIEYVPLKIAQAAVAEAYGDGKLDEAMDLIKTSINDVNTTLTEALKDDD
jgi:hypothetical protein